jgi:hypothetical protein
VIISSALEDAALRLVNFDLTEQGLLDLAERNTPGRGAEIVKLYRAHYPTNRPISSRQ